MFKDAEKFIIYQIRQSNQVPRHLIISVWSAVANSAADLRCTAYAWCLAKQTFFSLLTRAVFIWSDMAAELFFWAVELHMWEFCAAPRKVERLGDNANNINIFIVRSIVALYFFSTAAEFRSYKSIPSKWIVYRSLAEPSPELHLLAKILTFAKRRGQTRLPLLVCWELRKNDFHLITNVFSCTKSHAFVFLLTAWFIF